MLKIDPKRPVVYIAGPYRHKAEWGVACNIQRATELGRGVVQLGAAVIIPHRIFQGFEGLGVGGDDITGMCLNLVDRLDPARDAMLLVSPNCDQDSRGTAAEVERAGIRGVPVFREFTELLTFLTGKTDRLATPEPPKAPDPIPEVAIAVDRPKNLYAWVCSSCHRAGCLRSVSPCSAGSAFGKPMVISRDQAQAYGSLDQEFDHRKSTASQVDFETWGPKE